MPRVVTQGGDQRTRGQSGWQYYRDRGSRDADARSRTQGRADDIARDRSSQGDRGQRDRDARSRDQRDRDATPRASGRTWQYADRVRDRDWNRGADRSGDRDQRGDRDGNRDRDRDWDGNRGGHGDRYADYWRRDRDHNHNHNHQRSRYGYGYNRFVVSLAIGRPYGLYRPYYGGSLYSYNRGRYYGYPYYGGGNAGRYYGTRYTTGYTPTQYATEQYAVQEYIAQPEPTSTSVIPTNSAAASYQEAAEAAFREGRYEEALRHSSHALIEDGENGYVHLFLSQTLFAVGDYEGAAVTLDQGLSMLDPENWGYVVENYEAFYTGDGYVTQMNELVTFLEENPDASYGYLVRGYHYLYLGELAGARLQLERAVELEPRDPFGVELLKAAGGEVPASVSEATAPRAAAEPSAPAVPAAGGE